MQSLWFGIAVAAVVVLTRQSRAATPAGLAAADGPKLCETAFALTRLGEVGLEAARRVEALAQTARANAASIEALIAAASTQGKPGDAWNAQRDRARQKASGAQSAAAALTLLANNATQQAMAAARTGADLSGFLLVLAAVGTGGSSAGGRSCLKGDEQTITGGAVDTNAHYILAKTCTSHFGLLAEKKLRSAETGCSKTGNTDAKRRGIARAQHRDCASAGAEQCALLALSQAGTAGSNGLLIANGGTVNEDKTEKTTKKQNKQEDNTRQLHRNKSGQLRRHRLGGRHSQARRKEQHGHARKDRGSTRRQR
ncbi:hypothetical protein ERJ75_001782600 [Trypanosoma vivax]|nr:hypothetical protein ERJ75_001782600 [Trypanosoma vivax]